MQHTPHSNSSVTNRKLAREQFPNINPEGRNQHQINTRKPFFLANLQLVSKFHILREKFPLILSKINSLNLFFNLPLDVISNQIMVF